MHITSRENHIIKEYIKLARSGKHRREARRFVLEGARLIKDAVLSGVHIQAVLFEENALKKNTTLSDLYAFLNEKNIDIYTVTEALADALADTINTQGVFCIAFMLDKHIFSDRIETNGIYLALESIQEPGNLGTILRTAEAFGINGVFLSGDCADIYSPKVLRASMGAVFRLPFLLADNLPSTLTELKAKGMACLAAVADIDAEDIINVKISGGAVISIGNEGNGLSQNSIDACGEKVTIRMKGRAESLNAAAAAAVLMWEITARR